VDTNIILLDGREGRGLRGVVFKPSREKPGTQWRKATFFLIFSAHYTFCKIVGDGLTHWKRKIDSNPSLGLQQ